MHVHISTGNKKMGQIPSVSLPAVSTCRTCRCNAKCYAKRIERIRPNVAKAYQENFDLYLHNPQQYWREIEAHIMLTQYFRFHVGGDIVNYAYLLEMIRIAKNHPHCQILCFTKKDYLVNMYVRDYGYPPSNLKIIFSAWEGFIPRNPYHFPEAHVIYRDGSTTAPDGAMTCEGNCVECAIHNDGCWTLQKGQAIKFHEH